MTSRGRDPTVAKYARLAPEYDRRWSFYITSSVDHTLARLAPQPSHRLLDVGCGTGQLLSALATRPEPLQLYGVDATPEMLAVARRRVPSTVALVTARAERLPFGDSSFDWVVSTNSLHYIRDPHASLKECGRVLKPHGKIVITDWCDDYFACKVCDRALRLLSRAHARTYGRHECEQLLEKAAFTRVAIERYRISWLWGLMTAAADKPAR